MREKFSQIFNKVLESKFPEKEVVSKQEIMQFSTKLRINSQTEKARANGNHSVIFGQLDDTPIILKTTANPIFASRTLTEIYTLIELDGTLDETFSTPKLIDFGFSNDKYLWFMTERISEEYLSGNTQNDVDTLAKATVSILRSELKVPFKDDKRLELVKEGNAVKLLEKLNVIAKEWQTSFAEDIEDLITIMNTYDMKTLPPATVHGDLVARHIIDLGANKYHIYDWELTGGAWFWGYEPAYVFHRTYTRDGDEVLAKRYLETLLSLMTDHEKELLKLSFRPMLAQRIIGGYKDYSDVMSVEYKRNKKLHDEIKDYERLPYNFFRYTY